MALKQKKEINTGEMVGEGVKFDRIRRITG